MTDSPSPPPAPSRPLHQQFAIPHTFQPELTFAQAMISAGGAFLRILLGSILFAVYGAYAWALCSKIQGSYWRIAAVVPLTAGFLCLLGLLLAGISALVRLLLATTPK